MSKRILKYNYYKVIQGNWGYGWDDESFYPSNSLGWMPKQDRELLRSDFKEYCFSGGAHRIIFRRELNPDYVN